MLSRVANGLYWMSRYVERAENTARIVDVNLQLMLNIRNLNDSTLVGRAYLYGLMAAGERGVDRVVEILTGEIRRTMALLGASSVTDLSERHVRMP